MGDAEEHEKPSDGDEKSTYTALGIVFAGVGVVFMVTMDTAALALPFIALGIAFFAMGVSAARKKSAGEPGNDEPPSA
jgi:sulfite exporter TauE/SafE